MARFTNTGGVFRRGVPGSSGRERAPSAPGGRRGSEERFRQLFDDHGHEVFRFFVRKGFSPDDAGDLTQEAFFRVYQGLEGFRGAASARTWIFSIAQNVYRNVRRHDSASKRQGTEVPIDETPAEGGRPAPGPPLEDRTVRDPLAATLARERRELLWRAVDDLPDRMRQCVLLRAGHDLKYREIASVLQVSIDTVKSQLHQAKDRLRRSLGGHFGDLDELEEGGPS